MVLEIISFWLYQTSGGGVFVFDVDQISRYINVFVFLLYRHYQIWKHRMDLNMYVQMADSDLRSYLIQFAEHMILGVNRRLLTMNIINVTYHHSIKEIFAYTLCNQQ